MIRVPVDQEVRAMKKVMAVLIIVGLCVAALPAISDAGGYYGRPYSRGYHGHGWGYGGALVGGLVAGTIIGGVLAPRVYAPPPPPAAAPPARTR